MTGVCWSRLEKCVSAGDSPREAYDPGGRVAAELNGEEAGTVDRRDLALEAAFTSMSLRERWSEPGVVGTLEPASLPGAEHKNTFLTFDQFICSNPSNLCAV